MVVKALERFNTVLISESEKDFIVMIVFTEEFADIKFKFRRDGSLISYSYRGEKDEILYQYDFEKALKLVSEHVLMIKSTIIQAY